MKASIETIYSQWRELYQLRCIEALLDWDQQVTMPITGSAARAEQFELMARYSHRVMTSKHLADGVEELFQKIETFGANDKINLCEIRRQVRRAQAIPESLRAEQAHTAALCHAAWSEARPRSDFSAVTPLLTKIINLAKAEAACLTEFKLPYDALLDVYEPGQTTAALKPLFTTLATDLAKLVTKASSQSQKQKPIKAECSISAQQKLVHAILSDLSFPENSTRLDAAAHPFMTTIGRNDTRITTRYDSKNPLSALYSVLHEYGHALYEMNLDQAHYGLACGSACSLGIHESQSRLWENLVGRGQAFSEYLAPQLKRFLDINCSAAELNSTVNAVEPSLIRVEADELTYSLHIVIRFLLEAQIINDQLSVSDLPLAWNSLYQEYLGVTPADDRDGVLQDIHWYSGMIGYFPTYALGNIYAAQLWQHLRAQMPQLDTQIAQGEFEPLQSSLRTQVHQHGMRLRGAALIEQITNKPVDSGAFIDYLSAKLL